jgi:hypothetical protein
MLGSSPCSAAEDGADGEDLDGDCMGLGLLAFAVYVFATRQDSE